MRLLKMPDECVRIGHITERFVREYVTTGNFRN